MMEGGVWEVPPCCQRVQGGRGGPLCLYGVSFVVLALGEEDVGGRQLIHLCGVGEVAGDGDPGGVVLAGGGVGDDVVGRAFIVGGVLHRVQLECGGVASAMGAFVWLLRGAPLWFRPGIVAPGFRGPYLGGCRCCRLTEGGGVGV